MPLIVSFPLLPNFFSTSPNIYKGQLRSILQNSLTFKNYQECNRKLILYKIFDQYSCLFITKKSQDYQVNTNTITLISKINHRQVQIMGASQKSKGSEQICRYCLGEHLRQRPLVRPCSCQFAHVECLKQWMSNSTVPKCEVCHGDISLDELHKHSLYSQLAKLITFREIFRAVVVVLLLLAIEQIASLLFNQFHQITPKKIASRSILLIFLTSLTTALLSRKESMLRSISVLFILLSMPLMIIVYWPMMKRTVGQLFISLFCLAMLIIIPLGFTIKRNLSKTKVMEEDTQ